MVSKEQLPNYEDLCDAIASTDIPYYRVGFDPDQKKGEVVVPYICLVPNATEDVVADGSNFCEITNYIVELYERGSRLETEQKVENALKEAGFSFIRYFADFENGIVEMAYHLSVIGR